MRLQVAAILALLANAACLALFVAGTFAPQWFPHAMTHPPAWFWAAAVATFVVLLLLSRIGTMARDARFARRAGAGDLPPR